MAKLINKVVESGKRWYNILYFCSNHLIITFLNSIIGTYECKVDAKGRLLLPAPFKKQLADCLQDGFVLKRSVFQPCLELYPMKEWEIMMQKINKLNRFVKKNNDFIRRFTVDGLNINPNGIYVDVTFGGGGHSKEILSRLGSNGKLFGFDQDEDAWENSLTDERFTLIQENFRYIKRFLRFHGIKQVDGILADLGVSSHQFDVPERGFSTRFDADLDMRMSKRNELDASKVINEYDEANLKRVFLDYGELKIAPALARTIIEAREIKAISTTDELKIVLSRYLPDQFKNKVLAQIYQAVRIEVNQEMEVLKEFLEQSLEILKPEGRLSVISYHSLEDRLVKRFMKNGLFEGEPERDFFGNFSVPFKSIGKLIVPSEAEIKINNRARSAKLRIAEKK